MNIFRFYYHKRRNCNKLPFQSREDGKHWVEGARQPWDCVKLASIQRRLVQSVFWPAGVCSTGDLLSYDWLASSVHSTLHIFATRTVSFLLVNRPFHKRGKPTDKTCFWTRSLKSWPPSRLFPAIDCVTKTPPWSHRTDTSSVPPPKIVTELEG